MRGLRDRTVKAKGREGQNHDNHGDDDFHARNDSGRGRDPIVSGWLTHAVRLALGEPFPDMSRVAVTELPEENAPVMLRAAYIADFCAIAKRRAGRSQNDDLLEIHTRDGRRPAHIRIGEDYRAWVMPTRFEHNADAWMPHAW